jgi:hypothetical protein
MTSNRRLAFALVAAVACCATSRMAKAAVYQIAISPPASLALNLGTTIYPGDHAEGLSPLNETAQLMTTNASGGALGPMTYDDVTNVLALDYGYGSFYGFNDLVGNWTDTHIHGNGTNTALFPAANGSVGVTVGLASFHVAQGPKSGRVTTNVALSATQETWLFNNQLYLNVHSNSFPPGEIRGQLVIVPEPATLALTSIALAALSMARRRK